MMKHTLFFAFLLSFLFYSCNSETSNESIDTETTNTTQKLYFGGDIITMNSDSPEYAEAIVVDEDKIVFVGSKAEALKKYANATKIDLEGKTLMPSFLDPHSHFMSAIRMVNQVNLASPPMGTAESIEDIMNYLVDFKKEKNIKEGEWIIGWGYDQDLLKEKRHITKLDIDKYLPNNKVMIIHVSMHGAVLNSKALNWAGINADTKTPDGGIINRMPDSDEPAGLIMETAFIPTFEKLPKPSDDEMMEMVKPAQMLYASNGYTQAIEGFSFIEDMDFLLKADSLDKFFIDIISLPGYPQMDKWLKNPKYKFGEYYNHLKFGGGKFTLDGSPQGKTALMCSPYHTGGPSGQKNWKGETSITREDLANMTKHMVENNIQINFHANGCGAINDAIYAIENAGVKAGDNRRPIIIHSQFQNIEHLKKYVELGISPSYFTNHTFYWGDVHINNMGMEIASFISPEKTAKSMGLITSNHTDFNVTPLDPFFLIWTATNRITRSGVVLGADERISTYQALTDITSGTAWQFFEENRKGKIKVGMLADLVILKNNPLKQDVKDLRDNEVVETIKEGVVIFSNHK